MSKIIFTDADGVILDWEGCFHEWMDYKGYTRVSHNNAIWDLSHHYGMQRDHILSLVIEFNNSSWINIVEEFRNAKEGIDKLTAAGYKFVVITAMGIDKGSFAARTANLHNLFGTEWLEELICIETAGEKDTILAETLKRYPTAKYWIEDDVTNFESGVDAGLESFLVDHAYNRMYYHLDKHRVHDFNEVADRILKKGP